MILPRSSRNSLEPIGGLVKFVNYLTVNAPLLDVSPIFDGLGNLIGEPQKYQFDPVWAFFDLFLTHSAMILNKYLSSYLRGIILIA